MTKEIILVAGTSYPHYKAKSNARAREAAETEWELLETKKDPHSVAKRLHEKKRWRTYCLRQARSSLDQKGEDTRITLFDFEKGTREGLSRDKRGKLLRDRHGLPTFADEDDQLGKLNPNNYRFLDFSNVVNKGNVSELRKIKLVPVMQAPPSIKSNEEPQIRYFTGISELSPKTLTLGQYADKFYRGSEHPKESSISMMHVYNYFQNVSWKSPGTVIEFHIFSHSFAGGPILVNTNSRIMRSSRVATNRDRNIGIERDPLDKDARSWDFQPANLDIEHFAKAFAGGATSFIWGCNIRTFMFLLIEETLMKREKDGRWPGSMQFTWSDKWGALSEFHWLFGDPSPASNPSVTSGPQTIASIQKVLDDEIFGTYMQQLANVSRNRVFGGLPGTSSNYDAPGLKNQLLHVQMDRTRDDDDAFRNELNFYADVMHKQFGPMDDGFAPPFGRGYGIFLP